MTNPFQVCGGTVTGTGTSRQVTVANATAAGDTLLVAVVVNNTTCIPSACGDTQGNLYTLDKSFTTTQPTLYQYRSPGATGGSGGGATAALATSDKVTITTNAVSGNVGIDFLDAPGVGAVDQTAAIATGTSITPSVSATPTANNEICVSVFATAGAGGAPAVNSPFTTLGSVQTGSNPYGTAAYDVLTGGSGVAQNLDADDHVGGVACRACGRSARGQAARPSPARTLALARTPPLASASPILTPARGPGWPLSASPIPAPPAGPTRRPWPRPSPCRGHRVGDRAGHSSASPIPTPARGTDAAAISASASRTPGRWTGLATLGVSGADTGSGADVASVGVTAADTGSGTGLATVGVSDSDTGTGTDAAAIVSGGGVRFRHRHRDGQRLLIPALAVSRVTTPTGPP